MSDFLSSLIDRTVGRAPVLEPRRLSRFESGPDTAGPAPGRRAPQLIEEISDEAPALTVLRRAVPANPATGDTRMAAEPSVTGPPSIPTRRAADDHPRDAQPIESHSRISEPIVGKSQANAHLETIRETIEHRTVVTGDHGDPARPFGTRPLRPEPSPSQPDHQDRPPLVSPHERPDVGGRLRPPAVPPRVSSLQQTSIAPRLAPAPESRHPAAAPTIHVTIGRIEVRTAPGPAVSSTPRSRSAPKLNLEDYLSSRAGGAR